MQSTKVILVLAPPGGGKGTQCKEIANKLGYIHISVGDLCRNAVLQNTELGKQVNEYIKNGDLVPDDLMINVIENRLKESDAINQGVLLDGYPRTVRQAINLTKTPVIIIDRVILLTCPNNVCMERILSRRIDPITGASYSLAFPECQPSNNAQLIQRDNDGNKANIELRLKYYYMNLGQVLQNFKGKIFSINGHNKVNEVTKDIMKALHEPVIQESKKFKNKKSKVIKEVANEEQCAICMDSPANFLVIPCGHQCGCETCLSEISAQNNAKCPICRKKMDSFVQVFKSGLNDNNDSQDIDIELEEQNEWITEDNLWSNHDALINQNLLISAFEKNISDQLQISINPVTNMNNTNVAITIKTQDINMSQRVPVDICCVIDVSGSMALDATYQDPNDETKKISEGLTILDIVKHSVKTVICTLTDQDRLSIVSFSSQSQIVFKLIEMTEINKKLAISALEKLSPDGQTNIWAGLEFGLNSLKDAPNIMTGSIISRKRNIFLLTDGQPTNAPIHGEEKALKQYFENNQFTCQVHTFGFGYSLKSDLLYNLANQASGSFSFIPDAKIVGTCFVNAVSNACTTFTQNCTVYLVPKNGATLLGPNVIHLGPLQYGQTRNLVISMNNMDLFVNSSSQQSQQSNLESDTSKGKEEEPQLKKVKDDLEYLEVVIGYESHRVTAHGSSHIITEDALCGYVHNLTVNTIHDAINKCTLGQGGVAVQSMKSLIGEITAILALSNDVRIAKMLEDVQGRMSKAISTPERFNRWGQHYLRAITRAHELQLCTNFMDPGLQIYGGTLFSQLREQGGQIFLQIELKKSYNNLLSSHQQNQPTNNTPSYNNYQQQSSVSNNTYYGGNKGGCFDESCTLMVHDIYTGKRSSTKISKVKKNDIITINYLDGSEGIARIRHIVKIDYHDQDMIKFLDSGLMLTRKHPIRINNKWIKPMDLIPNKNIKVTMATTDYLYNFILDRTEVLPLVNGVECVTFGHDIKEVWHPLYASKEIINLVDALDLVQRNIYVSITKI